MIRAIRSTLLLLTALALGRTVHAQTYPFRAFGSDEGLASPFVHAMAQDAKGYLWIGTGEGLARFDGVKARMFTTADGLVENPVSAILALPDGGLWIGHNEGGVSRWNGQRFASIDLHDQCSSTIHAIIADGSGGIWIAALNEGLFHVDATGQVKKTATADGPALWYALLRTSDGKLITGRSDGVRAYSVNTDGTLAAVPRVSDVTTVPVLSLASSGDRVFAGLDGEGVIAFYWTSAGPGSAAPLLPDQLGSALVKGLTIDQDHHLIVATFGQGAYEIQFADDGSVLSATRYHEGNGLGSDNVSIAFVDRENGLWLARFSIGIARRLDRAVTWYAAEDGTLTDIRSIGSRQGNTLLGTTSGILVVSGASGAIIDTLDARDGLPGDPITALVTTADGQLWAGTERSGLYVAPPDGPFTPVQLGNDYLSRHVHGLAIHAEELWVATGNGIYVVGGGTRHLTTVTGLPHNSVNAVLTDRGGQIWIGCNNGGTAVQVGDELQRGTTNSGGGTQHITGIAQDSRGAIWFATEGGGLLRNLAGSTERLGSPEGLASDFVQAVAADGEGHIWAAHRGAISRIDVATGSVRVFDRTLGLPPERKVNALAVDAEGAVWIATGEGAVRYDPNMEKPALAPPTVDLSGIKANDKDLDISAPITLEPDLYRMEFTFAGISLKDPEAVTYRFKLEGHDLEWSTGNVPIAYYRRIESGTYQFLVQACNGTACSETTTSISFVVLAPIWQRWWFITLALFAAVASAFGVVRARLRNQKRVQIYLERTLDERTREVQIHTEELERKNKDITDSITYARRIQQAALPSEQQLKEHFPRSFIFHQPRDIVSGDFYWFKRFDDKFLMACADCTGHGVPGAFMSMIGSMLLRDISADKGVNTPDAVLQQLDSELRSVLHHDDGEHRSNDGMDISVCEIDLRTHKLRVASAMHDMLVFRDRELIRVKGERWSIGGFQRNGHPNSFERMEHDLRPGDRIYLYSDGIPDQFGGVQGKKLKVSGVMDMVASFCDLSMEEQSHLFRTKFLNWMSDYEQVDDVLFIGIEI